MKEKRCRIAMGKRLRRCPSFRCHGVMPDWNDFPRRAQEELRLCQKIFYPSRLYEVLFISLGKKIFPRNYYRLMGHKIRQTELFQFLDIPHPRTRIYYGKERKAKIHQDFEPPFVAKEPIGSSQGKGVWLIRDDTALDLYLQRCFPAYIQEYLPIDRDLRVVLIAGKVIHAYWRIAPPGEFRNNVSQGATISYDDIPGSALVFAMDVARRCRFDEVGLDICRYRNRYYVLEANMVYGLEGFFGLGLNLHELVAALDRGGHL